MTQTTDHVSDPVRSPSVLQCCTAAAGLVRGAIWPRRIDQRFIRSIVDAGLPFLSSYEPLWLGLGTVAFDLIVALIVTSLLRARLGRRIWRWVHWLAYAAWPVAVAHSFGSSPDMQSGWLLGLGVVCVLAVVAAVGWRVAAGGRDVPRPARVSEVFNQVRGARGGRSHREAPYQESPYPEPAHLAAPPVPAGGRQQ